MNRCPQCNQTFNDSTDFCVDDGTRLEFYESRGSIIVSVDDNTPSEETPTQYVPKPQQAESLPTAPANANLLYAVIGGLVAVILLGVAYLVIQDVRGGDNDRSRAENTNTSVNANTVTTDVSSMAKNNVATTAKEPELIPKPETASAPENRETNKSSEQGSKGKLLTRGFNGRVIMLNALIRSAPTMYAPAIFAVPFNEPVKIGKSAGGNNPWYRVTTVGGQTGWMHGNTIEFVR